MWVVFYCMVEVSRLIAVFAAKCVARTTWHVYDPGDTCDVEKCSASTAETDLLYNVPLVFPLTSARNLY